jgi:acyl-lipid Delta6-acetylenase / acyl-lipid (9-3)-desaturase
LNFYATLGKSKFSESLPDEICFDKKKKHFESEIGKMAPKKEDEKLILHIDGVAYDATKFAAIHPGGDIIRSYAGRDATDVFHAFHGDEAHKRLTVVRRSNDKSDQQSASKAPGALLQDFRALRATFKDRGWLDASLLWYTYKTLSTLALGILGIYLAVVYEWVFVGALTLGLSWQQFGWLTHEYAHHCVLDDRTANHWLAFFFGNLLQGFDVFWWAERHNQHHAVPNVLGGHEAQGDPDIDNLPVVAWDVVDLKRVATWPQWAKGLLRWQGYYFLFFMTLLRLVWALQSLRFVPTMASGANVLHRQYAAVSKYTLYGFWAWQVALALFMPSLASALLFFFVSNMVGGFGIAIVVFFNHHSMEKVADNASVDNFVTVQARTTRNCTPSRLVDWLWGGLNYQIEHHLFPTAPRHNLSRLTPEIKALFAKHNVPYLCEDFSDGVKQMCSHLDWVAQQLPAYEAGQLKID